CHRDAGHCPYRRVAHVLAHAGQPSGGPPATAGVHRRATCRLVGREGTAMTAKPRPRSRVRIMLSVLSACGLAALAWASFVQPAAHLIYNPSDSVPVGWYRIERTDSPPRPLSVGDIVLTRLPTDVAALAAQRGYLPSHIPLLKRVG